MLRFERIRSEKMLRAGLSAVLAGLFVLGLSACEREGPAERAGEQIDEAASEVREGVENAAEEVESAVDDARQ
jgi:hypothetical protein